MANYPIKMLKDENGTPFVPLVAPGAINDGQGFDLLTELDKKLEKTNIIAGDNVTITTSGNDITINSAASGASANVIDNLDQTTGGAGVLDAHQGHVLKEMIPEVVNNLTTVDGTKALSAYQGYLLNHKIVPTGGTTGQVLKKKSGTDNDLEWGDAADPNAIIGDGSIKKIVELTYADYQALETVDPDTEYHILDAASSLDNLQATLDSLQEQIDDLKTPNYITGSPAEAIVLNGTAWQVYDIPLTMINLQGTGLSIEDGKIKIGSNITNIRYNAHFNWHRDSGTANSQAVYFRLNLIRNGTKNVINQQIDILQPGFYGGAQFSSNWVVQEGDLISLGYMVATSDSYSSITAGYFETFLTVEKIS